MNVKTTMKRAYCFPFESVLIKCTVAVLFFFLMMDTIVSRSALIGSHVELT